MFVFPIRAQVIGNILDDLPVWTGACKRLEDLIQPLNTPLGAGECSFFFKAWRCGEDDVGEVAGLSAEDGLTHEENEAAQRSPDACGVWIARAQIHSHP